MGSPRPESLAGPTVEIGALLAEAARAGEIVVSNAVVALVPGSGLQFASRGVAALGSLGEWPLYSVKGVS